MKSVMHEASSISKAIEQAWEKAEKPGEFSVKILEEPQKNFLGFTKRSAKVALFFDQIRGDSRARTSNEPRPQKTSTRPQDQAASGRRPQQERYSSDRQQQPQRAPAERQQPQHQQEKKEAPVRTQQERKPLWNDAMIEHTKKWLVETLADMDLSHVTFTIEPSDFYLRVTFNETIFPDVMREKRLFASFATLIMETLKRTFKMGFRGHKIVLIHAKQ